jgi:osmoprotectant transport system substrate-binding protein
VGCWPSSLLRWHRGPCSPAPAGVDLRHAPEARIRVFDDAADVYGAVADGTCDFGEVFTTDGRIDALDLEVVVDPGVF